MAAWQLPFSISVILNNRNIALSAAAAQVPGPAGHCPHPAGGAPAGAGALQAARRAGHAAELQHIQVRGDRVFINERTHT